LNFERTHHDQTSVSKRNELFLPPTRALRDEDLLHHPSLDVMLPIDCQQRRRQQQHLTSVRPPQPLLFRRLNVSKKAANVRAVDV
jgi:hypothetical protein